MTSEYCPMRLISLTPHSRLPQFWAIASARRIDGAAMSVPPRAYWNVASSASDFLVQAWRMRSIASFWSLGNRRAISIAPWIPATSRAAAASATADAVAAATLVLPNGFIAVLLSPLLMCFSPVWLLVAVHRLEDPVPALQHVPAPDLLLVDLEVRLVEPRPVLLLPRPDSSAVHAQEFGILHRVLHVELQSNRLQFDGVYLGAHRAQVQSF